MSLLVLIPLSLVMGVIGLGAFFWALEHGQFDDPEGAASRIPLADAQIDRPSLEPIRTGAGTSDRS